MPPVRPCCGVSFPADGWDGCLRRIRGEATFRPMFMSVRDQVAATAEQQTKQSFKSFREQEVDVVVLSGSRLESSSLFCSLAEFEGEFGCSAETACPEAVISQKNEFGEMEKGVVLQDSKQRFRRLVQFYEEYHCHKD